MNARERGQYDFRTNLAIVLAGVLIWSTNVVLGENDGFIYLGLFLILAGALNSMYTSFHMADAALRENDDEEEDEKEEDKAA